MRFGNQTRVHWKYSRQLTSELTFQALVNESGKVFDCLKVYHEKSKKNYLFLVSGGCVPQIPPTFRLPASILDAI